MGVIQRVKKDKPLQRVAKNISLVGICCFLVACSSRQKSESLSTPFQPIQSKPVGDSITTQGENDSPFWSADGTRLLFSSRNRLNHKNWQIYEMDVAQAKERRITFSDGDATSPMYALSDKKIIYASTTDEIKERLSLTGGSDASSEIYMSDLSGLDILRLTHHPGFDGSIRPSGKHEDEFYFVSSDQGITRIMKFNLKTLSISPVFASHPESRRDFVSQRNRFAWVSLNPQQSVTQILFVGDNSLKSAKAANTIDMVIQDLEWVPGQNKLILSISTQSSPFLKIAMFNLDLNCFSTLVSHDRAHLRQARISPDLSKIAYVSDQIEGVRQIFVKAIDWSQAKCDNP